MKQVEQLATRRGGHSVDGGFQEELGQRLGMRAGEGHLFLDFSGWWERGKDS